MKMGHVSLQNYLGVEQFNGAHGSEIKPVVPSYSPLDRTSFMHDYGSETESAV